MSRKLVSLYSGCGGIDIGFERAGFETVFATDIWNLACNTLEKNFSNAEVVCDDIQNIDFTRVSRTHKNIDVLTGGPPCPPFSKSRFYRKEKSRGIEDTSSSTSTSKMSGRFRSNSDLRNEFLNRISAPR